MINNKKIPIYFMPGLAASSKIFENICFEADKYEFYYLDWKLPYENEPLTNYVKRLLENVVHDMPILVGVSFGGIIIQEMTKFIQVRKLVIISSVLSETEFPSRMIMAKKLKLYKLFPTTIFSNYEVLKHIMVGKSLRKRFELYKQYLQMNDKKYLDWAIKNVINWESDLKLTNEHVIRIHGEKDEVFPIKYINTNHCYVIPNATHAMIVYKYKWFNKNLPLILNQMKL